MSRLEDLESDRRAYRRAAGRWAFFVTVICIGGAVNASPLSLTWRLGLTAALMLLTWAASVMARGE